MSYLSPLEMFYKWEQENPEDIYLSQPVMEIGIIGLLMNMVLKLEKWHLI